jgi:hypothetical protein
MCTVGIFYCVATNPQVIENNICEHTDSLNAALSRGMTSLWVTFASAKSGLREE